MANTIAPKRWYRLIPIAFITYSLAYLDRANFGFAAAGGMARDLNITPSVSSLLASLFFLGYFFFQIPGTLYASRKSAKKLIFWSLLAWGILAMATGWVHNIYLMMCIRFGLGVAESAVMPSMLLFLSRWFTRNERSRANTFLILGNPVTILWMSVLSGYLVHLEGWRQMFILEGLPALIWAFCWWKLVEDTPEQAGWLTHSQKNALEEALKLEQRSLAPVKNIREAFRMRKVILLCIMYALWSIGVYGFVLWLPSILEKAPHMNLVKTGWLSAVPYLAAVLAMYGASHFSDKTLHRKKYIWPFLLLGAISFYISYLLGQGHFWVSYSLLVVAGGAMYAPYGPFFAAITDILPRNVSAGAIALINSLGALGSFAGAYLVGFLNGITGGFAASYLLMAVSLLLAALLTLPALKSTS